MIFNEIHIQTVSRKYKVCPTTAHHEPLPSIEDTFIKQHYIFFPAWRSHVNLEEFRIAFLPWSTFTVVRLLGLLPSCLRVWICERVVCAETNWKVYSFSPLYKGLKASSGFFCPHFNTATHYLESDNEETCIPLHAWVTWKCYRKEKFPLLCVSSLCSSCVPVSISVVCHVCVWEILDIHCFVY